MIYIEKLTLPSLDRDVVDACNPAYEFQYTHKSAYPYHILSHQGLFEVDFSDITIITGGNGTGKSTLLNIIAQKLELSRPTPFNKTEYFDSYLSLCFIKKSLGAMQRSSNISSYGRIITSDEVFDYMIDTRLKNDDIDDKRQDVIKEWRRLNEAEMPREINLEDPESIRAYTYQWHAKKSSCPKYIREQVGFNLAENSNGENAFKFFTEAIKPNGLYLLDEPENSLEAERQIDLNEFIASMARYERCQFIISTHSPFLMSMPGARLYNLDVHPARVMPWTDVKTVRIYKEFFDKHADEF